MSSTMFIPHQVHPATPPPSYDEAMGWIPYPTPFSREETMNPNPPTTVICPPDQVENKDTWAAKTVRITIIIIFTLVAVFMLAAIIKST